jgi:hypothetical protein
MTGSEEETTVVPTELLRTLLDLATNTLDFSSGYWDTEDTVAARRVAELLGVDPMTVTPAEHRRNYPHPFVARSKANYYCRTCDMPREHGAHEGHRFVELIDGLSQ